MKFFERNRETLRERGIDPDRLPPGQYFTERFPVLDIGDCPGEVDPSSWSLRLFGAVTEERTLSWSELLAMPSTTITTDLHCVTKWSKFDTAWRGVKFSDLVALVDVDPAAAYVLEHARGGYTTNVPLADCLSEDCLVAYEYEGEAITAEHGGPLRLILPALYLWKSAKWLEGIEFRTSEQLGFWERNGYHAYGDPWREQRYSGR